EGVVHARPRLPGGAGDVAAGRRGPPARRLAVGGGPAEEVADAEGATAERAHDLPPEESRGTRGDGAAGPGPARWPAGGGVGGRAAGCGRAMGATAPPAPAGSMDGLGTGHVKGAIDDVLHEELATATGGVEVHRPRTACTIGLPSTFARAGGC